MHILFVYDEAGIQSVGRFPIEKLAEHNVEICGSGSNTFKVVHLFKSDVVSGLLLLPHFRGTEAAANAIYEANRKGSNRVILHRQ